MAFSPENLKIWVDSREYSRQIQTATYPPFTKGTYSLLEGAKSPVQVWEYMLDPILHLMERKLVKNGKRHWTGYLPNYVSFRMALGMVNPLRIDDIWDPDALAYNPRLSKILGGAPVCKAQRGQAASEVQQTVGRCVGGGGLCGGRRGHRPTQGEEADADVHPA